MDACQLKRQPKPANSVSVSHRTPTHRAQAAGKFWPPTPCESLVDQAAEWRESAEAAACQQRGLPLCPCWHRCAPPWVSMGAVSTADEAQ